MDLLNSYTPPSEMALRMGMAVIFGAVLGLDREARDKPAGLRTHMLIALAAAVFTLLTFELTRTALSFDDLVRVDPVRVMEAVVAGVAFLGAGTIIQSRGRIRGITTGASIWLAGAMGVAAGGGYYVIAVLTLGFTLVVMTLIGFLEHWATRRLAGARDNED
jgi:putative Mg2+ transporter-C (MgtC) family protein